MKRRLFNFAAAMSLVILAVTLVFWGRSYLGKSVWFVPWRGTLLVAGVDRDAQSLAIETTHSSSQTPQEWVVDIRRYAPVTPWGEWLGFGYFRANPARSLPTYDIVIFAIPYWAIALCATVLPAWWSLRSYRAARHARGGRCAKCGYDLRATPDRCPECGTAKDRR